MPKPSWEAPQPRLRALQTMKTTSLLACKEARRLHTKPSDGGDAMSAMNMSAAVLTLIYDACYGDATNAIGNVAPNPTRLGADATKASTHCRAASQAQPSSTYIRLIGKLSLASGPACRRQHVLPSSTQTIELSEHHSVVHLSSMKST